MSGPERSSSEVAVVTGAASGVGAATVEALGEDGFLVIGVDVADVGAGPRSVGEWVQGSVTSRETWDRVVEVSHRHDPLGPSCLVTCAAELVIRPFLETTTRDWSRLFETNVLGTIRGMHALMPAMIERGRGTIAIVCSVDSLFVEADLSAYAGSKAALLQVMRSAALEHSGDGLRVNAVCPGAIDTGFFRRALAESGDPDRALAEHLRRIPSGEILKPEQVAAVLRFLTGDGASGISGAAITIDGGLTTTFDFDRGPAEADR